MVAYLEKSRMVSTGVGHVAIHYNENTIGKRLEI
jgi:hypothetical protein